MTSGIQRTLADFTPVLGRLWVSNQKNVLLSTKQVIYADTRANTHHANTPHSSLNRPFRITSEESMMRIFHGSRFEEFQELSIGLLMKPSKRRGNLPP